MKNSKLDLVQILDLLYYYAYEQATVRLLERECRIRLETIINWRHFIRDVFTQYFILHPVKVGGSRHVVGVEEFDVKRHIRKHTANSKNVQSVFVGIDNETQESFLVAVDQGNAETLLPVMKDVVLPDTIVVSTLWKTYGTHDDVEYERLEMKHDLKFEDVNAQDTSILNLWLRAKQWFNKGTGPSTAQLPSYLNEFMWRERFGHDPFQMLLEHIRLAYPL